MTKTIDKKRSIGDVAEEIGLETHVIRFWESKFPQIKPQIGKGNRRYYFDKEIAVLNKIKSLLYDEGYSIAGLQKLLKKRKDSVLKEQNLEFLLVDAVENASIKDDSKKDASNNRATPDFSLDDFIDHNSDNLNQLNSNQSNNILIAKVACSEELDDGAEHKTAMSKDTYEDSSSAPTEQLPLKVEFQKKSNLTMVFTPEIKAHINKIISQIEFNLTKLEQ